MHLTGRRWRGSVSDLRLFVWKSWRRRFTGTTGEGLCPRWPGRLRRRVSSCPRVGVRRLRKPLAMPPPARWESSAPGAPHGADRQRVMQALGDCQPWQSWNGIALFSSRSLYLPRRRGSRGRLYPVVSPSNSPAPKVLKQTAPTPFWRASGRIPQRSSDAKRAHGKDDPHHRGRFRALVSAPSG